MADPSFLDWCQKHGIETHGVQPGYVAEGWRGVIAIKVLCPGTVVMSVPGNLLMSVMSAKQDPKLAAVLGQHQLSSHQILAIHLLQEASKGTASFWAPYIQQLPQYFTTFMCWPAEAVQALQLAHAQAVATAAADKARREWMSAWPAIQDLGFAKKWSSLGAWCWAASCVLSRTMYHPDDPPCGCLTPLADLHNYAPPPPPYTPALVEGVQQLLSRSLQSNTSAEAAHHDSNTVQLGAEDAGGGSNGGMGDSCLCGDGCYDTEQGVYYIVTRRSYSPGDQVFLCYGRHPNLDLLELYGFMLDDNPHEEAALPVQLLQQALHQALQRQHQQQQGERQWRRQHMNHPQQQQQAGFSCGLDVDAADCFIHVNGQPSWQLLKALRLAAASPAELRSQSHLAVSGEPISFASEHAVLCSLSAACKAQLQQLPTTLLEDEVLISSMTAAAHAQAAPAKAEASGEPRVCMDDELSTSRTGSQQQRQQPQQDCNKVQKPEVAVQVEGSQLSQQQQQQQRRQQLCSPAQHKQQPTQQEEQERECLMLAVLWRACYRRTLGRCIEQCQQAIQTLEGCTR